MSANLYKIYSHKFWRHRQNQKSLILHKIHNIQQNWLHFTKTLLSASSVYHQIKEHHLTNRSRVSLHFSNFALPWRNWFPVPFTKTSVLECLNFVNNIHTFFATIPFRLHFYIVSLYFKEITKKTENGGCDTTKKYTENVFNSKPFIGKNHESAVIGCPLFYHNYLFL